MGINSLGIDYGLKRTGLSITSSGLNPTPLTILSSANKKDKNYDNTDDFISKIIDIVNQMDIDQIVIGNPINKDGSIGLQSKLTSNFAKILLSKLHDKMKIDIPPIFLQDERYTSAYASAQLLSDSKGNGKISKGLDSYSAVLILKEFYESGGGDAEIVQWIFK